MRKVLQVTNNAIPTVAVGANMPLGLVNVNCPRPCTEEVFNVTTSASDVVIINKSGYYRVNYNASLLAAAAGDLTLSLKLNGVVVNTLTVTTVAGATSAVAFTKYIYIPCNCQLNPNSVPARLEITLGGVQVTSGTSNTIVEG